jgi:membrane-associated phospholipid phosphatase
VVAAVTGVLILAGLTIAVAAEHVPWSIDRFLRDTIYLRYDRTGRRIDSVMNHTSTAMVVLAAVGATISGYAGSRRAAALFVAGPGLGVVVSEVIKKLVVRHLDGLTFDGFPSGHTAAAVALALSLGLVLRPRGVFAGRTPRAARVTGYLLGTAFALAIGTFLIALRWHLPTDVLAGAVLGVTSVAVMAPTIDHLATHRPAFLASHR